ncbi:hypothetical protein K3555_11650 [Leisingera sp. M527]|uniref:hypothetical protein n=1 Tax=Leisingera sp. M527 TaxID=2867014 RepID=UPI0021A5BD11|nr:hypothetical protein [Leisingera sp. M527]UWQ31263.1 hypothetical protein K3555_11650 [Leisingera sp. M527]
MTGNDVFKKKSVSERITELRAAAADYAEQRERLVIAASRHRMAQARRWKTVGERAAEVDAAVEALAETQRRVADLVASLAGDGALDDFNGFLASKH